MDCPGLPGISGWVYNTDDLACQRRFGHAQVSGDGTSMPITDPNELEAIKADRIWSSSMRRNPISDR